MKSINKKNKLYKQYLNSPSKERSQKFKTFKDKMNMLIRKSKRSHFFTKFELAKNDMKQTGRTINNVIGKGQKNPYTVSLRMSVTMCLQILKIFQISLMSSL